MKKMLICNKKVIAYIIFIVTILLVFSNHSYGAEISEDIENIDESLYPGYKGIIKSLMAEHPTWNFKLYYTGLDWNEVITNEFQGHGSSPKNLSPANNAYYDGEWICPYCGRITYDSESWYCASEVAIKYMMDPRNSINNSDIFQFQDLSSTNISRENIAKMVEGTFLDEEECIDAIIEVSQEYSVNGYYLVARILQEQGRDGSYLSWGEGYNDYYVGVYNLFNIGAYGNGEENVILNGLSYAESAGWYSKADSIRGGTSFVVNSYIAIGQNTLYFQKFNVVTDNLYNHQYMQNILAAQNEGTTLKGTYSEIDSDFSSSYTFLIPMYDNMPAQNSIRPSTVTEDTPNIEEAIINANGGLKVKSMPGIASPTIAGAAEGSTVKILVRATEKVDGYYWDKILTDTGHYGYVAREAEDGSKVYLLPVNGGNIENNAEEVAKKMKIVDDKYFECSPSIEIESIKKIYENAVIDSDVVATGTTIKIDDKQYVIVKKGDLDGNGDINIFDALIILDYLKGKVTLEQECFVKASKIVSETESNIFDFLKLLDYLKGNVEL